MRKLKILMLIPHLKFGGAQRVFYNLSCHLSAHHTVVECVFNLDHRHAFQSGNQLTSLDVPAGKNTFSKIYRFIQRCRRLRKLKQGIKPDICISHLEGADLVNMLSKTGEKTICWVHGSKIHDENIEGWLGRIRHRLLIPFTYKSSDAVVTVSHAIGQELVDLYGVQKKNVLTIHNFFEVERIRELCQTPLSEDLLNVFASGKTIVTAGRLARQKNPLNLLHWFAQSRLRTTAKLVIVGDGEFREAALEACKKYELKTYHVWTEMELRGTYNVYFMGYQENPFRFLVHASLFILPSLWEGFPMVIGEAMASGLPIASADCPTGPREFLSDAEFGSDPVKTALFTEYGLLLPLLKIEHFDEWNKGISKLLEDEKMLSEYARMSAIRVQKFSSAAFDNSIRELFTHLLTRKTDTSS